MGPADADGRSPTGGLGSRSLTSNPVHVDQLIAIAHHEVARGPTDDECRQYLHLGEGCA